jgi:hypothetical protein
MNPPKEFLSGADDRVGVPKTPAAIALARAFSLFLMPPLRRQPRQTPHSDVTAAIDLAENLMSDGSPVV